MSRVDCIALTNISSKFYLQAEVGNGDCSNEESFIVISDVMERNASVIDCCRANCKGRSSLINYDNPFFILITKKLQQPFNFNLTWEADSTYPSTNNRTGLATKCGEVLGGASGTIRYKPGVTTENNGRCVWIIVPQPRPRSFISITVNTGGGTAMSDTDDQLYMMQLTDANGDDIPNAPNITRIRYGTYTARSREVYIVFYSDFAMSGNGFSLLWRSAGDLIKMESDVTTQFAHIKSDRGSATSVWRQAAVSSNLYQVFIFTPTLPATYTDGLQLQLNQTSPVVNGSECIQNELTFFTPVNGLLSKTVVNCSNSRSGVIENADGMVVAVMKSQNASKVAIDFAWTLEPQMENRTNVVLQDNMCGGTITADKGSLNFKVGQRYFKYERCLWLLNAPNSTHITFKLEKSGFSSYSDYILVTSIDPETGTLRNDTVKISSDSRSRTLNGSMMVIVFRSDASYYYYSTQSGFSLKFLARGYESNPQYRYKLRHISDINGSIEYEDENVGANEIYVIGSSFTLRSDGPLSTPIAVDLKEGLFRKANGSCTYDSLRFYEPTFFNSGSWLRKAQFPNMSGDQCPDANSIPERANLLSPNCSSFLAIYKPVSNPVSHVNGTQKWFRFDYHAAATVRPSSVSAYLRPSCGNVIRADHGQISYKEYSLYDNSERCSWRVEVPNAKIIAFYLEKSGLEECCDFVTVYPENGLNGVRLSSTSRTGFVRGPNAIVNFTSDSSKTGYGFRLLFENNPDVETPDLDQPCGRVLVQESGSIKFSKPASTNASYQSTCVWTIQANNRASINVTTQPRLRSIPLPYSGNTYVLEILKSNATGNSSTTLSSSQIQVTKLEKSRQYLFAGPTIFVVTSLVTNSAIDFQILFEGKGGLVANTTFFMHEPLFANSGSLNSSQLETWSTPILEESDDNANYTLDYITMVISNFSTRVYLEAAVDNGSCSNGESFLVITDVMGSSATVKDCCQTSCEGNSSLMSYDNPFVILITKPFQQTFNFNIAWEADAAYPPVNNKTGLLRKCGEVLGGSAGSINYKTDTSFEPNDRCIWVIVPQPGPRSKIMIQVSSIGIYDSDDHLYMMQLVDANGEELPNAPNKTKLVRYQIYEARSREVYIIFYSDSSSQGSGFSLTWSVAGEVIKSPNDITPQFTFIHSNNGSATRALTRPHLTNSNSFYQVFIFTPVIPSTYKYGLHFHLNTTMQSESNCTFTGLQIFSPVGGQLTKAEPKCDNSTETIFEDADGMVMIIVSSRQNASSEEVLEFKWTDEFENANSTDLLIDNDNCGGVITASHGILKYKQGKDYFRDERCVWLLHSPNSTSISLKLLDDAFESCCDYILATTIDPTNGTLRNNTYQIKRENRTATFNDPMVVIEFHSDGSIHGTGFALRFSARGETTYDYDFKLHHASDPNGTFEFPFPDENDTAIAGRDIMYVVASSIVTEHDFNKNPRTPLAIDWRGGVFKKANDSCSYDSLTLYEPRITDWFPKDMLPNRNDSSCPEHVTLPEKRDIFGLSFPTFLAIYKPLSPDANVSSFHFDYHLIEVSYSCGGTLKDEYGVISYKEATSYNNSEICVWSVEVPDAQRVTFHLQRSGFEKCCDYVTISSAETPAIKLTSTNGIATVTGSKINVTFVSDGSVMGSGFRLHFENNTNVFVEDENCGGLIIGENGLLNYKLGTYYPNNERCVYLLHSPNSRSITLELLEDEFEVCCDFLHVNTIDPTNGTLRNDTVAITRANNTRTFDESLLVIVFRSDSGTRGKGFSLQFTSNGTNANPDYNYKLRHVSDSYGTIDYPSAEWVDEESTNNEIFVLASSLNTRDGDALFTSMINWNSGTFQKSNDSCDYGSLSFYSTQYFKGWLERPRLPSVNATSTCSNVIHEPARRNIFNTEFSSFLAIYKPISVGVENENATNFSFTYEEGNDKCGGVYVGNNSGEIIYKENIRYDANEQCVFLVQVPQAETIVFSLQTRGFEDCCDYVTVGSLAAFGETQSPPVIMSTTNSTTIITGSVAIVTFTSDGSIQQFGFRLQFHARTKATTNSQYTYILAHQNQPPPLEFSQQMGPNQVAIFAYARSFKNNTQLNITSFRPQINARCDSDSLSIYGMQNMRDKGFVLEQTFTASDIVRNGTFRTQKANKNCTAFDDNQFHSCENIRDCTDTPNGSMLYLSSTSFVAIYKSVNATSSLKFRGFVLNGNVNA